MKRIANFLQRKPGFYLILTSVLTCTVVVTPSWAQDKRDSTQSSGTWGSMITTVQDEALVEDSSGGNTPEKIAQKNRIRKLWLANLNDPLRRRLGIILASNLKPATAQTLIFLLSLIEGTEGGSGCEDPRNPDSCTHVNLDQILAFRDMLCDELMTQLGHPVPDEAGGGGLGDPCRQDFMTDEGLPPQQAGAIDYEGGTAPIDLSVLEGKDVEKDKMGPLIQYTEEDNFWLKRKKMARLIVQNQGILGVGNPLVAQDDEDDEDDDCADTDNDGYCDDTECIDNNNDGYCSDDECTDLNDNNICDEKETDDDEDSDDGGNSPGQDEANCNSERVPGDWSCGACAPLSESHHDNCAAGIAFGGWHIVAIPQEKTCYQPVYDACGNKVSFNNRTELCEDEVKTLEPCKDKIYIEDFGR